MIEKELTMANNQRQYESATVFNARIVDMRHLWMPSTEYMGKPSAKPNYFAMFIVPKTQHQWHTEPALAGIAAACGKIYQSNPQVVSWPVADGDLPGPKGTVSDFAKGHWMFSASTSNPPNVELVQQGGVLVKLPGKAGVKSGDYTMAGVTAAVKQNDPRGVKLYLNAVVFSAPGEEIVFANSVSGAELMQQAQQQGLQVAGFSGSPGFGGGAPGGFGAPQGGFPGQQQGGFAPQPGFTPGGAPNAQTGGFAAPGMAPNGPAFGGGAAFPSNPQGAPGFGGHAVPGQNVAPAFGQPGGAFAPNGGGFPGR
jgi:hypothetical protein